MAQTSDKVYGCSVCPEWKTLRRTGRRSYEDHANLAHPNVASVRLDLPRQPRTGVRSARRLQRQQSQQQQQQPPPPPPQGLVVPPSAPDVLAAPSIVAGQFMPDVDQDTTTTTAATTNLVVLQASALRTWCANFNQRDDAIRAALRQPASVAGIEQIDPAYIQLSADNDGNELARRFAVNTLGLHETQADDLVRRVSELYGGDLGLGEQGGDVEMGGDVEGTVMVREEVVGQLTKLLNAQLWLEESIRRTTEGLQRMG